jgi:subtilase family serine protease
MRRLMAVVVIALIGAAAPAHSAPAPAVPRAHPLHRYGRAPGSATPLATTSYAYGYTPADIKAAYNITGLGRGRTVAVVSAYDSPTAEADLAAYRARFGLPPCPSSNGCFRKVNQSGIAGSYPTPDINWSRETALDIEMASAACSTCRILLVEASSDSLNDLARAVDRAATMGAVAISNSYGADEWSSENYFGYHWNHPGIAITASAGDAGFGTEFPAVLGSVIAVGGTSLRRSATTRGWTETAWSGTGSGCSAFVPKPAWQRDPGCSGRTVADVSAVADPATGVAVYSSYASSGFNWYVFGGTSAASPIIAGLFALAGNTATAYETSYIAGHKASLFDAVGGSNGTCLLAYLCVAGIRYDGPTGLGTPNGTGAF